MEKLDRTITLIVSQITQYTGAEAELPTDEEAEIL